MTVGIGCLAESSDWRFSSADLCSRHVLILYQLVPFFPVCSYQKEPIKNEEKPKRGYLQKTIPAPTPQRPNISLTRQARRKESEKQVAVTRTGLQREASKAGISFAK